MCVATGERVVLREKRTRSASCGDGRAVERMCVATGQLVVAVDQEHVLWRRTRRRADGRSDGPAVHAVVPMEPWKERVVRRTRERRARSTSCRGASRLARAVSPDAPTRGGGGVGGSAGARGCGGRGDACRRVRRSGRRLTGSARSGSVRARTSGRARQERRGGGSGRRRCAARRRAPGVAQDRRRGSPESGRIGGEDARSAQGAGRVQRGDAVGARPAEPRATGSARRRAARRRSARRTGPRRRAQGMRPTRPGSRERRDSGRLGVNPKSARIFGDKIWGKMR